jgi:DUF971 family protein
MPSHLVPRGRGLPVGHHAVPLVFSDGHDRGIYPWPYLAALACGD